VIAEPSLEDLKQSKIGIYKERKKRRDERLAPFVKSLLGASVPGRAE